ncbi:MAG: hypothetical protein ABI661_06740 [Gammaproteobacteria bacterium]
MKRLGMWSASTQGVLGVVYAATLGIGMNATGFDQPIVDPVLAIMELLTLVSAPLLVVMMAAVHVAAPADYKACSLTALAFMILVAGLTSAVHFVGLTALRQVGAAGLAWPSPLYALELLAWDIFLGLSLLFAAPVFQGSGLKRSIRLCLLATGGLCLTGSIGPATGDMRYQFIAVVGYGALLPVTCFLLARSFRGASVHGGAHHAA